MFGDREKKKKERLKENVLPVTVLASLIAGTIALPLLPRFAGPLAVAQARKTPTPENLITEMPTRLVRSKTTGSPGTKRRKERPPPIQHNSALTVSTTPSLLSPSAASPTAASLASPRQVKAGALPFSLGRRSSQGDIQASDVPTSASLPDLRMNGLSQLGTNTASHSTSNLHRRPRREKPLSNSKKVHMLRANYFRREDQFLSALDKISNKLVVVPKQARLSALRAELALLNNDLPSEVDIPVICPASVHSDHARSSSHHRIVRISPAEATVLNSAERVPYLLMVEVLLDDFDFNPDRPENESLIARILQEEASGNRQRIFDLSEAPRASRVAEPVDEGPSSVFEPYGGDIGTSPITGMNEKFDLARDRDGSGPASSTQWAASSSASTSQSTVSSRGGTPRSSDPRRSNSPNPRKSGRHNETPDLSALATHMRTAANMLAQLEASGNKRPKAEVAAIKAKIIASMQTLEEQSFFFAETAPLPTFDSIMANAAAAPLPSYNDRIGTEDNEDETKKSILHAGAARMENDQMTSGVERKADRDDPSAATFGEEWKQKRERIRKSSPYGSCANWDLLSVIVKTGADLRQEAFACQLIHVCGKIWERAQVPVWIKRMRILVTGESSGLIETITNGTSLHSLKRSLTIASMSSGLNPRGRIASLKDHFVKTFGEDDTPTYAAAVDAFIRSLAAYSVICYILQLKDRHNGNVLTRAMYSQLAEALEQADADTSVNAVLIQGSSECFTAGNDIGDFLEQPPADLDTPVFHFMRSLLNCRKPVIAAVAGVAVGIGTTLLLHCDLVYVSRDARLRMPFVNLGLCPEFGSSLILPRLLGHAKAAELLLLGEGFTGEQAAAWGIATEALGSGESALAKAREVAARFETLAPGAVQVSKHLMKSVDREQLRRVIEEEGALFTQRLKSPEAIAALSAFIVRR